MLAPTLVIGGLATATLALHLRDPHQQGSWGQCPLYSATGWYCPGCGGLRAVNDLTGGHLAAALSSNIMVTLLIPVVSFALGVWALERWQGHDRQRRWRHANLYASVAVAALLVFTVARNLAFGAWLAP